MVLYDLQQLLHADFNALAYTYSMQVLFWFQTMGKDIFPSLWNTYEAL